MTLSGRVSQRSVSVYVHGHVVCLYARAVGVGGCWGWGLRASVEGLNRQKMENRNMCTTCDARIYLRKGSGRIE